MNRKQIITYMLTLAMLLVSLVDPIVTTVSAVIAYLVPDAMYQMAMRSTDKPTIAAFGMLVGMRWIAYLGSLFVGINIGLDFAAWRIDRAASRSKPLK